MKALLLASLLLLGPTHLWGQAFARSWNAWFGQLKAGGVYGMQDFAPSYSFGLYKSQQNHGYSIDFGGANLLDSKIIMGNLSVHQDLLRLTRNRRSPFYLYGNMGFGLTHLRNPQLQDHFLLRGDDMLQLQLGLSPTYFLSRDFALQFSVQYQKQLLIDYQLEQLWNVQIGMFFLIPNFKPF